MRGASRPGARAYALLAAVAGASLAMTAPTMASPANPPLDHEQVRSFLEAEIPEILDEFEIPGAIVSVVGGGGVRISAGFGLADVADDRRATAESIFNVGSVSKLILWTAVMQLVEQGRIDLDADVNDYLTTFRVPDTHEEPITMANLLTHTAGFEDRWTGVQARTAADLVPLGDFSRTRSQIGCGAQVRSRPTRTTAPLSRGTSSSRSRGNRSPTTSSSVSSNPSA